MSRAAVRRDQPFWGPRQIAFILITTISLFATLRRAADANPLPDLAQEYQNLVSESWTDNSTDNSTEIAADTDVYVIKAVVYEIGILTDADNTTSGESTERQERVDISLYDPPRRDDEFS